MPATQLETPTQTLTALASNLRRKLAGSKNDFEEAAQAFTSFLLTEESKRFFMNKPFMKEFVRTTLVPLARDANRLDLNFYKYLAQISKAYGIEAGGA